MACELSSIKCADKRIGRRIEIVFKMDKPATQSDVTGEKNPVGGKRTSAIATAMHGFSECGEAVQIFLPPSQPRLHILQAVLEGMASGQEGSVRRKCP